MSRSSESTRWTIIRGAADGRPVDRAEFARRYASIIRAYLGARWRMSPLLLREMDDAAQDVFVECFKEGGALSRADPDQRGGFRAFLFGLVRNVARRYEERRARKEKQPPSGFEAEAEETPLSQVFDRAWAASMLRQAIALHTEKTKDPQRPEILRLRFQEGVAIREIAQRWQADPARIHQEYREARKEYRQALIEVVGAHQQGTKAEIEAECVRLFGFFG